MRAETQSHTAAEVGVDRQGRKVSLTEEFGLRPVCSGDCEHCG